MVVRDDGARRGRHGSRRIDTRARARSSVAPARGMRRRGVHDHGDLRADDGAALDHSTFESFDAFHDLEQAGLRSIATQDIPADAVTGIQYLLCVGIAIIAFLMDFAAQVLRKPAIAGIPLVGLLLVPSFVRPELGDPFLFALTAGAYLGMLLVGARRGVGASEVTIAAALVLPLALPQVRPATPPPFRWGTDRHGLEPDPHPRRRLASGQPDARCHLLVNLTDPALPPTCRS